MSYLFLLLSFFLFVGQVQAQPQQNPQRELTLSVKGTVKIPADRIVFQVDVNAEGSTPQEAYNLHKKRESALVDLLEKYNINEKNIQYQPISISKQRRRTDSKDYETYYQTKQQVTLTFSNFDKFEKIQIGLIQHNYDHFSSQFTSSKLKQAKDNALKAAIKKASHKANLITQAAGVALGSITKIQYNEVRVMYPRASKRMSFNMAMSSPSSSLLKYKRMLTVTASINIHYQIQDLM